jgi:hypothetical protein
MPSRVGHALLALRAHLDRSLFKQGQSESRFGRGEAVLIVVAFLALATVAQLFRLGPTIALDSLWAEDGPVFLQEALTQSFWHAVSAEYSGYLVVFPRLVGEAASIGPLRDAAAVTSILAALAVSVSGVLVWFASAGHIANPYLRATLAIATVLTSVGGLEAIDAAAYSSWYMLFAVFWILLWRPKNDLAAVAGAGLVLLAGLSNPGLWFFLPLALLRACCVRDRRDAIIVGSWFLAAALQALATATSDYQAVQPVWTHDIWTVLLQRVLDGAAFGLRLGGLAWDHLGWALLIGLIAAAVAIVVAGWRRGSWSQRWLALIAIPTALVMFVVSIYQRAVAEPMLWPGGSSFGAAGRYAIVPVLLLISVGFAFLDREEALRDRPRRIWWASGAAIALVLVSVAVSFPAADEAARGTPRWSEAIDQAAAACEQGGTAEIPSSPPGFQIFLPCSELRGAR